MNKQSNIVNVNTPIEFGSKKISEFTVREPKAGELRGIKLLDVLQMDAAAYEQLLPRITEPTLSVEHVRALPLPDLLAFMEVVGNLSAPAG